MQLSFYDYVTFITFAASLLVFVKKPVPIYLLLFPVYYFLVIIFGMLMEYQANHGLYNTNIINVWGILEFCFYFFIIHQNIVNVKVKRAILIIIFIYGFFAFFNFLFIQKKDGMNPINFATGCLIVVSLCIYYFSELFRKAEVQSLARLPSFWIISGILFNNVLFFPINSLSYFMVEWSRANYSTYKVIFENMDKISNMIIVLTSLLYSIGFICRIRISKSIL